jgi:hypothetical protein
LECRPFIFCCEVMVGSHFLFWNCLFSHGWELI